MKKYIIISIILISTITFGFGEKITVKKLTKDDANKTIESISSIITNGKQVQFSKIDNSEYWFKSDNLKMKKDKNGFTLLYDDREFLKETNDKFVIEDTKKRFKASKESIEKLKAQIKVKADKMISDYFPEDNYTFIRVGLSTDGVLDLNGNVTEVISMLSPIYAKTINGIKVIGKGSESRLYFKPSGKLIGIKLNDLKSIDNPSLINDSNRINTDIDEIKTYLINKYQDYKNIKVEYLYLKKKDDLIPVYAILMTPGKGQKKLARYIPLNEFTSVRSIEEFINPQTIESNGDLK